MSRSRPRWADADVPLALLVGAVLVLAFVLPGVLADSDPAPRPPKTDPSIAPSATASSPPPGQEVLEATPITPGAPANPRETAAPPRATPGLARPAGPGTCVEVAPPRLSAVSFNMHSAWNRDRSSVQLDQIAAEIEATAADFVLLQEVDRNRRWTGSVDQPAYLAEKLGMYYAFGPNVDRGNGNQYGTAILSRYPISAADNTLLPNAGGGQQRGLLHAVVAAYGEQVSLYSTHFEHTSAALRDAQARAVAEVIAQDPNPSLLGGDLNSTPRTSAVATLDRALDDSWAVVGTGRGLTHPSPTPRARIDYLMYANGPRPVESVVLASAVSDHLAVRTVFEIGGPTEVCVPTLG